MHRRTTSVRRTELPFLTGTIVLFALLNVLCFRTGLYERFLAPDSSTAAFDGALRRVSTQSNDPAHDVLVLGDSRIFSGFDAPGAGVAAGDRVRFVNAGVPGTTPRCWYVFDRALDEHASRYAAVVIPVDTYSDDDGAIGSVDGDDHAVDLHYVALETRLDDIPRIAMSFPAAAGRADAFFQLLLRGPPLRDDIAAFASDPEQRIALLRSGAGPEPPAMRDGSLDGLRADFANDTLVAPDSYPVASVPELERQVLHRAVPSAAYARYRAEWLGPIVRRYRAAGVPVLFVRIPTRPLHRVMPPPASGSLPGFAHNDGAVLLDQTYPVSLERPQLFVDADHLNATGAKLFSAWLGRSVSAVLAHNLTPAQAQAPSANGSPSDVQPSGTAGHRFPLVAAISNAVAIGVPMRFQSYEFFIFFAGVVALYATIRNYAARRAILLLASWYFYARWNAWYLAVLIALTGTDYAMGILIEDANGVRRRVWLIAGVAANLLFLGTAKYADFITGSIATVFGMKVDPWALHVLVPIGISFHTFQSISYLVDTYRKKITAERNPLDYALYLAFFPQLLAGPIVRAGRFFREWAGKRRFRGLSSRDVSAGGLYIVTGLIKKTAIADRFAPVADAYFANPAAHPGWLSAVCGILAFTLQIYFDFSGYSDVAIGLARVLGFRFPPNFRRPYLAWSVSEFWRRWHMTLSYWLRDYVYIPIGGSRYGTAMTVRNLTITMLLGGLWHGANWTFIVWGGYHGALLSIERVANYTEISRRWKDRPAFRIAATATTFALVALGWVLFRSPTFTEAATVARMLVSGIPGTPIGDCALLALAAFLVTLEVASEMKIVRIRHTQVALRAALAAALLFVLELASYPGEAAQFIYFRF